MSRTAYRELLHLHWGAIQRLQTGYTYLVKYHCTILLAQFELAKASGLALKAKPIPII
jgi:hypothetical protein